MNLVECAAPEHLAQRGECDLDVIDVVPDRERRVDGRAAVEQLGNRGAHRFELGEVVHAVRCAKYVRREHAACARQRRVAPDAFSADRASDAVRRALRCARWSSARRIV
jgi:hypothetical protein